MTTPATAGAPSWSAVVRYAEVDQQGIVFNAHYLTYADETMGAFCHARGLLDVAERVHLVASNLTWAGPARWGETLDVDATCLRVGTTSFTMTFVMRVGERTCCTVETTYVLATDGRPEPLSADVRARLLDQRSGSEPA